MKILCIIICLFPGHLLAQKARGDLRFVWYNVENLFDPFDDSLKADEEFLPWGMRHWTWQRFENKINRLYKVLASSGGWHPPELIGLCEVENNFVLYRLCRKSPLRKYGYRWIHHESPDRRGIDVALLYLPAAFHPLAHSWHEIDFADTNKFSRDILYVNGTVNIQDTLHLILNHWPSRWEGKLESEPARLAAALVARQLFDSIIQQSDRAGILLAGDFNDEISDPGIMDVLGVKSCRSGFSDKLLYHLQEGRHAVVPGTLKYRGRWYSFDHIFASGGLLSGNKLHIFCDGLKIHAPAFLLERDTDWPGLKPYRTWHGYRYQPGFSDHLPVYVDLWFDRE